VEARIANIRAERRGEGQTLTPKQARALAGDWYHWFVVRHEARNHPAAYWEHVAGHVWDDFHDTVWGASSEEWHPEQDPWELWREDDKVKQRVRPLVSDHAESAQFLHAKRLTLDYASRDLFLDYLCEDLFAAIHILRKRASGDYSADPRPKLFPTFENQGDPGLTAWNLFERWITDAAPATSTVDRWRAVFLKLMEAFPTQSAAAFTTEELQAWLRSLISPGERSARTVNDVYKVAGRTVFGWAVDQKLLANNPFAAVRIKVPHAKSLRETKAFSADEMGIILTTAQAIENPRTKMEAAKRWLPWLCAYTGARSGEIAQLRGADIVTLEGIDAIRITPEAGTVKTRKARVVPLHEHLIEQGFLVFAKRSGRGPLFYNEPKDAPATREPTNPPKPRYTRTRERIGDWVRGLGVMDPELQPNHAWRHTFKQIGHRHEIAEHVLDAMVGHAPASVGRAYGAPTLVDMAKALQRFPRYVTATNADARCPSPL
jgi:integrase